MAEAAKPPSPAFPVTLAFVAGFVDTCGFVALFGLFTAHVTGNFVLIGASLINGHAGLLAKLLALPMFVIAVAATRFIVLAFEGRVLSPLRVLLGLQSLLLFGFMLAGWKLPGSGEPDRAASILTGLLGVAAMGVQNGYSRLLFPSSSPTTVMTGNVTQAVIDLVDLVRPSAAEAAKTRLTKMLPPVVSFAVGAILAAAVYSVWGYLSLLAPITMLLTLTALGDTPR